MSCEYDFYEIKTELQIALDGSFTGIYLLSAILMVRYFDTLTTNDEKILQNKAYMILFVATQMICWSSIIHYIAPFLCVGYEGYNFMEILIFCGTIISLFCMNILFIEKIQSQNTKIRIVLWILLGSIIIGTIVSFFMMRQIFLLEIKQIWGIYFYAGIPIFGVLLIMQFVVIYKNKNTSSQYRKIKLIFFGILVCLILKLLEIYSKSNDLILNLNKNGHFQWAISLKIGISICCEIFFCIFTIVFARNTYILNENSNLLSV